VAGAPEVVVDYAHTPDALDKALAALRPLAKSRGGQLWCVFGCGGNRDATKRPAMGAIAAQGADRVVVTSDNPRDEEPQAIIDQIVAGVPGGTASLILQIEPDRRLAILETLAAADPRDVVLIAGKGHEDYQEIHGVRHPFSDAVVAHAAMTARSHL
jgi:UDP-N-acetylmuramoyl-L-alanyl-D-glutamate--2,6-diaminopimelate ligase